MDRYAALGIYFCFVLFLFLRDRKLRPMTSWGLWVALLWVFLVGSKSLAYWLGADLEAEPSAEKYVEGNPLDRNVYLALIVLGLVYLSKHNISWGKLFRSNRWLVAFFAYFLISVAWSDFPFVSFKRWIKDIGNIIMVLLMLTNERPVEATKAVISRYIYVAIPLSLVLIYFVPEMGVTVHPQSGEILYLGITTDKNELGVVLAISGLFIVWDFLETLSGENHGKLDVMVRALLMAMVLWLVVIAKSATALICMTLGITILLLMRVQRFRDQIRYLGVYTVLAVMFLSALFFFTDVTALIVKLVEKDLTFTGRTDIWAGLLSEPIDPLIGVGYSSFWLKPSMIGSFHNIIQAHNGYLETYLNGGIIAVCLLFCLIVATGRKVKDEILAGSSFSVLLFSIFVISLFYNFTESMFNRLNMVWLMFLLATLSYPAEQAPAVSQVWTAVTPQLGPRQIAAPPNTQK